MIPSVYARWLAPLGLAAAIGWAATTSAHAFDFIYDLDTTHPVATELLSDPDLPTPGAQPEDPETIVDPNTPAPPLDTEAPVITPTNPPAESTPEPGTLLLGVIGTATAGFWARRRSV
jgi:outer membrane biosynthesis protein TonB